MSQYIHFYIRNGENFLPIGTFSRSSSIYSIANEELNVPYEKISALNGEKISICIRSANKALGLLKTRIEGWRKDKELIASFNNSVEDKLEAIADINRMIEDDEYELDILESTVGFFRTLSTIYDDIRYEDDYDEGDYIYCGIECYKPTAEDIV